MLRRLRSPSVKRDPWVSFQREFFGLAAHWLFCRQLLSGTEAYPSWACPDGASIGELDSQTEMVLMLQEWRGERAGPYNPNVRGSR